MMKKSKFIELVLINSASLLFILAVINIATFFINGIQDNFGRPQIGAQPEAQKNFSALPKQKEVVLPKVLYNLSGKIIKLENGAIIFNAEIISIGSDKKIVKTIESRKAIFSSSTKFNRLSFINNSPVETKIEIKDFKEGDYIEAISDKDISKSAEFTATQIRILP